MIKKSDQRRERERSDLKLFYEKKRAYFLIYYRLLFQHPKINCMAELWEEEEERNNQIYREKKRMS